MSMLLMVKAMQAKVGNPLRKLVLIKLADNANDDGECWPSYQHIADHCEVSRRSVMAHVKSLEEMGFIRREFRLGGEKGNKSNIFHLSIPSAAVSLGGEPNSLGGAGDSLGSERDSLEGGELDSPRTSHSLEPVNEPVIESNVSKPKKRFTPPTRNEVLDHMLTKHLQFDLAELESEKFINFYESKGWLVGKAKMKNWKAAASNWVARCQTEKKNAQTGQNGQNNFNEMIGQAYQLSNLGE